MPLASIGVGRQEPSLRLTDPFFGSRFSQEMILCARCGISPRENRKGQGTCSFGHDHGTAWVAMIGKPCDRSGQTRNEGRGRLNGQRSFGSFGIAVDGTGAGPDRAFRTMPTWPNARKVRIYRRGSPNMSRSTSCGRTEIKGARSRDGRRIPSPRSVGILALMACS